MNGPRNDAPFFPEERESFFNLDNEHSDEVIDILVQAGRAYDPERHDPDSVFFDDSYTGPSERELMGGCNRCGGLDDCYCMDDI